MYEYVRTSGMPINPNGNLALKRILVLTRMIPLSATKSPTNPVSETSTTTATIRHSIPLSATFMICQLKSNHQNFFVPTNARKPPSFPLFLSRTLIGQAQYHATRDLTLEKQQFEPWLIHIWLEAAFRRPMCPIAFRVPEMQNDLWPWPRHLVYI